MSRFAQAWALSPLFFVVGCISVAGNSFPLHSQGDQTASSYVLGVGGNGQTNGYVGTYFQLSYLDTLVTFRVTASGIPSGAIAPHMTISVADFKQSFFVTTTPAIYTCSCILKGGSLPMGKPPTYFVRIQLDNYFAPITPQLSISNLTISGAEISPADLTNLDQTARDAANTYIQFYRQGIRTIRVVDCYSQKPLPAGTQVTLALQQNEFSFGTVGYGLNRANAAWIDVDASGNYTPPAPPALGTTPSEAWNYQQNLLANFNMIVPSNAGKWQHEIQSGHENDPAAVSDVSLVDMSLVDGMIQFAQKNGLRMRMHNLLLGPNATSNQQQPQFAVNLLNQGAAGKADLSKAITTRISYYLGILGNRSKNYVEVDGLNESLHQPSYWNLYGAAGIADIYQQMNNAIAAAGGSTRNYLNEYNVLQYSSSLDSTGHGVTSDPYANWYRQNVDDIHGAVTGVGMQLYPDNSNPISPATMQEALQNLSVPGLPMSLTEFGVMIYSPKPAVEASDYTMAVNDLADALTMIYGTPQCTSFVIWTFGGPKSVNTATTTASFGSPVPVSQLFDGDWNITIVGNAYQNWMAKYKTNVTVTLDGNGEATFVGTYGTYNVTMFSPKAFPSEQTTTLTLSKNSPTIINLCYARLILPHWWFPYYILPWYVWHWPWPPPPPEWFGGEEFQNIIPHSH
jgi:GH35 family endo-1,4-beta-xylanase